MSALVSVIIPVFNREHLVRAAIDSALNATNDVPIEVVVVDDASTDGTWSLLCQWDDARVRAVRMTQNGGQSAARNRGLEVARGPFVKFLDSDDVLRRGHLSAEVRTLLDGAEIAVSGWESEMPDGKIVEHDAPRFDSILDDVLAGKAVPTSAALYRRREEWRWDSGLRKLDDWDYFSQAALGVESIATVPGSAYLLRSHPGARATDVTMLTNSREHHLILRKIERRLAQEGRLTEARKRRLAQYFYKELRVLCLHDRDAFEEACKHIAELDPSFRPLDEEAQRWMRVLATILGTRNAVRLHTAVKRIIKRL